MNSKERINEVMNSLDNIQRAEASPFLYDRIISKIHPRTERAAAKWVWLTTVSFILLLLLNFSALRKSGSQPERSEAQELLQGYQLMNTNNFNYN